jgi:hypothetical protein
MSELKSYYEACKHMLAARAFFDQSEYKSALKVKEILGKFQEFSRK